MSYLTFWIVYTESHELSSLYNFNVEKKGELPETTKPNIEPIGDNKSDNSTPIKVEKEADKNKEININHHPNKQTVPKWLTILLLILLVLVSAQY